LNETVDSFSLRGRGGRKRGRHGRAEGKKGGEVKQRKKAVFGASFIKLEGRSSPTFEAA
jgi:hypothetical protein